jgi:hypothetical protein
MQQLFVIARPGIGALLLALAALFLPACTASPPQAVGTPTPQASGQHTIIITDNSGSTHTINVVTGDSITWINQSNTTQSLQISTRVPMQRAPGIPAQNDGDDQIPPGESLTISFLEAGPVAMQITAQAEEAAPAAEQAPADPAAATPIPVPPAAPIDLPPTDPSQGFYIAPNGTPDGDGSMLNPWDMETGLIASEVRPGDTIWLLGGTYRGTFVSWHRGTAEAPVIIRAYPGERVVLDSGVGRKRSTITVMGQHTWFWGLEFTNSEAVRITQNEGSSPDDIQFGSGMNIGSSNAEEAGVGVRLINSVIHNMTSGVGMWRYAVDAEVYGCIIYNNGWQGPDRGHGHGIYTQNQVGTKRIVDNIIFNQFGYGIHAYGSVDAFLDGFHVEGNILFNNGALGRYGTEPGAAPQPNILIGGGAPASRAVVTNNMTYSSFDFRENIELDYADTTNRDIAVTDNYAVGGSPVLALGPWEEARVTGNTLYGQSTLVNLPLPETHDPARYTWNNNTYYSAQTTPFRFREQALTMNEWQQTTRLDSESRLAAPRPNDVAVFVRPNRYEPGRAHIAVYNWTGQESVLLDVAALLQPGTRYEIRNVQNYFGEPAVSGTYDGAPIRLPLGAVPPPDIVGGWAEEPPTTGPDFNAYVLTSSR